MPITPKTLLPVLTRPVTRLVEWHRLPVPLSTMNILVFREQLRALNLFPVHQDDGSPVPGSPPRHRTYDGSDYDPSSRAMGRAGSVLGRNVPPSASLPEQHPRLLHPSPRVISQRLLRRDEFLPASFLNLMAAAWTQFQTNGWFGHARPAVDETVAIPADDPEWPAPAITVHRNPVRHEAVAPGTGWDVHPNSQSHWWDGSQVYGSSEQICRRLRTGEDGKLIVVGGRLPASPEPAKAGLDDTGMNDNYWLGLSLLHTLFAKEHNAICDMLRAHHPSWGDERLFGVARLVNSALMAKIHTVEWTPAILHHPALRMAMNTNWYGLLGKWFRENVGRVSKGEMLSGILGSRMEHHGAPFAMTEEFIACYRMHTLLPDDYEFLSHHTGGRIATARLDDLIQHRTRAAGDCWDMPDLLYSFGVAHPGAITLHNYPETLRDFHSLDGQHIDLASVEIFRDRERGIPRYNEFRKMVHMKPVGSFTELTANPKWAKELEEVYEGDVDSVDFMTGSYAEPLPKGFGFSDTFFRIFILMASRRLRSDRFFTDDFTPEVYTPEGMRWVFKNSMLDVLARHHPELAPALTGVDNAFVPWRRVG